MSQTEAIRKHLERGRPITAIDALNRFNCFRLAARVAELREQGMPIAVRKIETASGKRIAEYRKA